MAALPKRSAATVLRQSRASARHQGVSLAPKDEALFADLATAYDDLSRLVPQMPAPHQQAIDHLLRAFAGLMQFAVRVHLVTRAGHGPTHGVH